MFGAGSLRRQKIDHLEADVQEKQAQINAQRQALEGMAQTVNDARKRASAYAAEILMLQRERRQLDARIEDLEHELRLARRHLNVCPTAIAVSEEDAAKARSNQ